MTKIYFRDLKANSDFTTWVIIHYRISSLNKAAKSCSSKHIFHLLGFTASLPVLASFLLSCRRALSRLPSYRFSPSHTSPHSSHTMSDATSITRSRASAHSLAFSSSSTPGTSVSLWSGDSDVDGDGFLQSSFRAGGPVLASIPAHCAPIRPNSRQNDLNRHSSEIGNRVREILTEYQISPSTVNTWGRISEVRGEPEPIPTVLIAIPHLDPPQSARWREAARTIHAILSPRFPGISVELIDEKLLRIPYCHPVPRSHPIAPRWDRICDDILRTSDVREWTGLACWHYGVESTPTENPVTLIVSVLESATGPFITSLRRIRGILAGYSVKGVDILFMKNERHSNFAQPGIGPKLPVETCDQYVQPGVSIGVQNSSAGSSTLGGFVELKFRNDPAWHPFGLTCFH